MLEYNKGQDAIHPRFSKLITALRTAVENDEGMHTRKQLHVTTALIVLDYLCNFGIDYIDLDSGFGATSLFTKF